MPRSEPSIQDKPAIVIVMGVSGVGKSTIAALLAAATGWPFLESDTLHSTASIEKMRREEPLTEADRQPWLAAIAARLNAWRAAGSSGVVACSALRRSHREKLVDGHADTVIVYLRAQKDTVLRRMEERQGHFMPAALLDSQYAMLEPPEADERVIDIDAMRPADVIVAEVLRHPRLHLAERGLPRRTPMIRPTESTQTILPNSDALARHVADWLLSHALASSGRFAVALSGGSTPQRIYHLLSVPPYRDRFPWQRTHFFWGDERFVPAGDPASNFGVARAALLQHVPIPADNVHPVPTEGMTPAEAAEAYARTLAEFHTSGRLDAADPLFDVTLLGLGTDGHTASLFPGSAVLGETTRWVMPVLDTAMGPRITLTYPALASSRRIAFLVSGADKRAVLARWRAGEDMPAARLQPTGSVDWFIDTGAAG